MISLELENRIKSLDEEVYKLRLQLKERRSKMKTEVGKSRREALEAACKAICEGCAMDVRVVRKTPHSVPCWEHLWPTEEKYCKASPIRALLFADSTR